MNHYYRLLLVSLLLLFFSNFSKAQGGGSGPTGTYKPQDNFISRMGEILPNAPNTAAIEKFGGVDIEMNTGVVRKSIELKPFISRKISVPVSMGFSTLGVRVNEYPSRVGLGWHLTAGGMISRVIYGKDDLVATRYLAGFTMNPNDEDPQTTTYAYNIFHTGNYDATPDIFSYNFGAYSGKFYFEINNGVYTIRPIEVTNIKFYYDPLLNAAWTFKAITPDGTIYLFGGPYAKETTKLGGGSQSFAEFTPNAWHLINITNQYGHSVNFVYENYYYAAVPTGRDQTHFKNDPLCGTSICPNQTANGCMNNSDVTTYMSANVKMLIEINNGSEGDKVQFNYSLAGYPEKIITDIKYYADNELRSTYEFGYDLLSVSGTYSSYIPLIKSIKEKGSSGAYISNGYTFSYFSKELIPARLTFKQDHWGFFNNKLNSTLVPVHEDPQVAIKFPYATADRNPDPAYAVVGMLKEISYPTGGKDVIEYEPNTFTETKDMNGYITHTESATGVSNSGYTTSSGFPFSITYDHLVQLNISCFYSVPNSPQPQPGAYIKIYNAVTNAEVYSKDQINPPVPPETGSNNYVEFINMEAGDYILKVMSKGVNVQTDCIIKKRNGQAPANQIVQTVIGGMRLKKVTTTSNSGDPAQVKRYYYGTMTDRDKSSAQYFNKPVYWMPFTLHDGVPSGSGGCETSQCNKIYYHQTMYATSTEKLYNGDGKMTEYASIIESIGGDEFESGAIEHKFDISQDALPQIIRGPIATNLSPHSNNSIWSLGETETSIYKNVDNALKKVKMTEFKNYVDPRLSTDQTFYFVSEVASPTCYLLSNGLIIGPAEVHPLYGVTRFNIATAWKYLQTLKETVYDENEGNPLVTQTDFTYDDLEHLNLTMKKFVNSKGETFTETFTHPVDYKTIYPYNQMIEKNIVSPVIDQVQMLTNNVVTNKVLSNVKVYYTGFYNNSFYDVQYADKAVDGNSPMERELALKYDNKGNITEILGKNAVYTSYLWGYAQRYPVAKIVGKQYSEISGLVNSSVLDDKMISDENLQSALRSAFLSLPNSLVSTYTYKHWTGITSEADPNWKYKFYEYDAFNRLVLVRDQDGKILKKICYNYNGMAEDCLSPTVYGNDEISQTFTKNNCGTCSVGSQVQYTVPMDKYISRISKPDANQKAQDDINVNGQAYANTNGTCGTATLPLTYNNQIYGTAGVGFIAVYSTKAPGPSYSFSIPGYGSGSLGCIPAGLYTLTISKPGNSWQILFNSGCFIQSGTSATFGKVNPATCSQITLQLDAQ